MKHFKFEQHGKRRLHSNPNTGEVKHYRWWLQKKLDFVHPRLIVALGAMAALALAGKPLSVSANRWPIVLDGQPSFITIHPSFLLRMPEEDRAKAWKGFCGGSQTRPENCRKTRRVSLPRIPTWLSLITPEAGLRGRTATNKHWWAPRRAAAP